jgi:hypothetical protein
MVTHTAGARSAVRPPPAFSVDSRLPVYVLATSAEGTRSALTAASRYAADLRARIILLRPHVVPFPDDMDGATVPARRRAEALRHLAQAIGLDVEIVSVLCRSEREVPTALLPPDALVLVGERRGRRWWPRRAERLAARLNRAGYRALLVQTLA